MWEQIGNPPYGLKPRPDLNSCRDRRTPYPNSHIKKAIFVYNSNKEFIRKFEGVTHAQKELNINHDIIKKYALLNTPYKGYIFSYERLSQEVSV